MVMAIGCTNGDNGDGDGGDGDSAIMVMTVDSSSDGDGGDGYSTVMVMTITGLAMFIVMEMVVI